LVLTEVAAVGCARHRVSDRSGLPDRLRPLFPYNEVCETNSFVVMNINRQLIEMSIKMIILIKKLIPKRAKDEKFPLASAVLAATTSKKSPAENG
jgi:hypothetical protein